jgi:hypothetical protein
METSKSAGDAAEEPSAKTKTADTHTQHKTKKANKKPENKGPL